MRSHVIYKIKSIINGKEYIGSTINYRQRKIEHLKGLRYNKHGNPKLQAHYNKYGENDLIFSIVEPIMFPELLLQREQYYLDTINPIFNICKIAGSPLGIKKSLENRKRQSEYSKTHPHHGMFQKGHKPTKETVEKMNISRLKYLKEHPPVKGEKHWRFGKNNTKEQNDKIGLNNKGKGRKKGFITSEQTKLKMRLCKRKPYKSKMAKHHQYILDNYKTKTQKELAKEFKVNQVTIFLILKKYGKTNSKNY